MKQNWQLVIMEPIISYLGLKTAEFSANYRSTDMLYDQEFEAFDAVRDKLISIFSLPLIPQIPFGLSFDVSKNYVLDL